ncbi:restriction endonuclease subunit S [Mycoplasma mycoides subsp. capri]|uniref:restriction endonuclease subunit S n=1 Tax=Mycoplasma mycoides TaxID=2102 RepID=UPI002240C177|nr:restriction endonuclease subunit S [Mycoplasma mycoides]UZK64572.1 restriction endonuclease subunit S [Mycoplasma mycoides subsp. capri]
MTTEQLRKSILQWAIQGKLTKQNPDESAVDLLNKIRLEKQKLIKENKIKKDDFTNSFIYKNTSDNCYYEKFENDREEKIEVPFEIPNNWVWVRHNTILKLIGGSQPPKSTFISYPKDNYIRLFQIRDYGDSPIPVYIPINKASKITNKGDILIARYGGSLGKVFIAEYGAYNVAMSKVTKLYINDHIDFNFLYFFYKSKIFQEKIKRNSRSAQDGFNSEEINDLLLPLPPLEEQLRIITLLNKLNLLLNKYSLIENELSELEKTFSIKLQKSVLNYAMQGQLVEQSINDNSKDLIEQIYKEKDGLLKQKKIKQNELQKSIIHKNISDNSYYENHNFVEVQLGLISSIYTGNSISKTQKDRFFRNVKGMSYIATKDIDFNREIDYANGVYIPNENLDKFKIAPKNSVLLCIEGGSAGRKIGLIDRDVTFGNKLCCINSNFVSNKFIFYYLQSDLFLNPFYKQMTGIIQGINLSLLKEIRIPVFSSRYQQAIMNKLDRIYSLINMLN